MYVLMVVQHCLYVSALQGETKSNRLVHYPLCETLMLSVASTLVYACVEPLWSKLHTGGFQTFSAIV